MRLLWICLPIVFTHAAGASEWKDPTLMKSVRQKMNLERLSELCPERVTDDMLYLNSNREGVTEKRPLLPSHKAYRLAQAICNHPDIARLFFEDPSDPGIGPLQFHPLLLAIHDLDATEKVALVEAIERSVLSRPRKITNINVERVLGRPLKKGRQHLLVVDIDDWLISTYQVPGGKPGDLLEWLVQAMVQTDSLTIVLAIAKHEPEFYASLGHSDIATFLRGLKQVYLNVRRQEHRPDQPVGCDKDLT